MKNAENFGAVTQPYLRNITLQSSAVFVPKTTKNKTR